MNHDIPTVQPADSSGGLPLARTVRLEYPSSGFGVFFRWLFRAVLVVSLLFNLFFLYKFLPTIRGSRLEERFYAGEMSARDRIAIIRIEGLIAEGLIEYPLAQIRDAAQDDSVKAAVVLINSPGGTITASDQLHKALSDLREGKWEKQGGKKPVVVLMGSVAASGGYYIAVPGNVLYAQPTTITGSIGVYGAFLDVSKFAEKHGVTMNIIKRGELKGGSMFKEMTPEERRHWESLIDDSYDRFQRIVNEGRKGKLKHGLREELKLLDSEGKPMIRRLADGGVFTAGQAEKYGLVDRIGYLDDAIREAKQLARLDDAHVFMYEKPFTWLGSLFGVHSSSPEVAAMLQNLPGVNARVWYLTPGYELTGLRVPGEFLRKIGP